MVTVTEVARAKILALLAQEGRQGLALRFAVEGRGPGGFRYRLGFVPPEERAADDTALDAGGFQIYVDPQSVPKLTGASIDYVEICDPTTLEVLVDGARLGSRALVAIACRVGATRLIDNLVLGEDPPPPIAASSPVG